MAQNNMGMVKLFGRNIKAVAEGEYKEFGDFIRIPSEEKKKKFCYPDAEKEEDQDCGGGDGSNSNTGEKTVKKPDKILPCPRCNSVDTKFCYFNNYNVNQPRYFCRNCQRYWTAGGSMRNVPVGAGRRKNKIPITSPPSTTGSAPVADIAACNQGDENSTGSQNYSVGPPWIYTCNPAPILPGTNFCLPPPSHWDFSVPGTWSIPIPWVPFQFSSMPSPPLGKHSRHDYILNQTINSDHLDNRKCQKVKRDSSGEATTTPTDEKSAWLTMGTESSKGDGLFKGFSKVEASPDVMHVNPAALSRSIWFRESTL